jgi:hypothetical protein
MFKELETLAKDSEEIRKQLRETAKSKVKPALKSAITDLISAVPTLTAVKWSQCTPYFNDGDTCEFRVNSPEFQFGEGEDFLGEYSADALPASVGPAQEKILRTFETELHKISELLEEAFGDHTEVTVTTTGIETEEYSHD